MSKTLRGAQGQKLNPDSPVLQLLGEDAVAKVLMALILRENPHGHSVKITVDDLHRLEEVVGKQDKANLAFISHHDSLEVKLVNDTEGKRLAEHEEQRTKAPRQ